MTYASARPADHVAEDPAGAAARAAGASKVYGVGDAVPGPAGSAESTLMHCAEREPAR